MLFRPRSREHLPRRTSKLVDLIYEKLTREIDRMKGIRIDAAFVPLDPRQEDAYRFCMDYCMETLDAAHVFPIHFWRDYELTKTYQASLESQHPDWCKRFHPISYEGQKFLVE